MKFKGKVLNRKSSAAKQRCLLPRYGDDPLQLVVTALPLTFNQLALKLLPEPIAPTKLIMHPGTDKIYIGPNNKPVQYSDEQDPAYKELKFKRAQRLNAWMVFAALEFETEIDWGIEKPAKLTRQTLAFWLDQLLLTFEHAGFSNGDIMLIIEQSMKLSNMTIEDIERERDSFLLKEREEKQELIHSQKLQGEQSITPSEDQ